MASASLSFVEKRYRIGEFAERAGVTIRALRHYDSLGVLRASGRSAGGYREYTEHDLERLQHIVTLKALGFELDAIARMLDDPSFDPAQVLEAQIGVLEDRRRKIDLAIRAMREAQRHAEHTAAQHWDAVVSVIRATIDMQDIEFERFFSPEQLESLRARELSSEEQDDISARWAQLFADIEAAAEIDPASAQAQALVARWDELTAAFTQRDPALEGALGRVYADPQNLRTMTDAMPSLPSAWAFIKRARTAGSG